MSPALSLSFALIAHGIPHGHLERSIQVKILPRIVQIVYEIAASDATFQQWPGALDDQRQQGLTDCVTRGLSVSIDRKHAAMQLVAVRWERRHHASVVMSFDVRYELGDSVQQLSLRDASFPDHPGSVRLAVTGREGVVVDNANVPATLGRSEPQPLAAGHHDPMAGTILASFRKRVDRPDPHRHVIASISLLFLGGACLLSWARWRR